MKTITITHKEIELEVSYDYSPEEPQSEYYPGCYEDIQIKEIYYKGVDVFYIYYENDLLSALSDLISDEIASEKKDVWF